MAAIDLTDSRVKGLKATGGRIEVKDTKYPLYCVVSATGSKAWQWRGRLPGGAHGRRTLGHYPTMSLAQARAAAMSIKADKRTAIVVPTVVPVVVPEADVMTVTKAWALYMANEGEQRKTALDKWRMFERDVEPSIGAMAIQDVTHDDLAALIEAKFEVAPVTSNRLHSLIGRFFKWSRTKGRTKTGLTHNPFADVVKLAEENARDRYLNEREIGYFFKALGQGNFARVIETLLYTVARRSDIFDLTWGQVKVDYLDIDVTKNGLPHVVYMTERVRELIGQRPANAKDNDPVFAIEKSGYSHPMARFRARMDKLAKADGETMEHWTLHDLRTTGTTIMAGFRDAQDRQLISGAIRDRLLGHKDPSVRGKHYERHDYFSEKKAALILWADFLDRVREK